MTRRMLSLLIAVVMIFAVVPAEFTTATLITMKPTTLPYEHVTMPLQHAYVRSFVKDEGIFLTHGTGLKLAPLSEYNKVVGFSIPSINREVFKEAIKFAPFYPLASPVIVTPTNSTQFNASKLPVKVVNTLYLPPVGDQGYVGSCNAWSSTYYVWTYMINWWRDNLHPNSTSDIMNPTFTYNLINGGGDYGSLPWDAMNLISTIGAVPLSDFPLYTYPPESVLQKLEEGNSTPFIEWDQHVTSVWPNLTQWEKAPHNSGTTDMYWWQYYEPGTPWLYRLPGQWYYLDFTNATQWNYTKALLAKGYVLQTTINVLPSFEFLGPKGIEQFLGYLYFYANWAKNYGGEYWANGTYANWTVSGLLDEAVKEYNDWAVNYVNKYFNGNQTVLMILLAQGNYSLGVIKHELKELNISLTDSVYNATLHLMPALYEKFFNNESWINNATFYLGTYSINGEKWFLNHGFNYLFTIANFEWMVHYIPLGEYTTRASYLNFYNYYSGWQGGHAVTIIGYSDSMQTPDGTGALIMVNSWGTQWGYNGYWYFSYKAVRSAGEYFNTTIDGILPVQFQVEWPVLWGGSSAFVYVPKAANYTPELMAVVGIKHPVRGEVIDGVYGNTQFIPAGIPVGLMVGNDTWEHNFLDFWNDYLWSDITNKTTAADLPQDHPFPNSPMAFDISNAIWNVTSYIYTHPNVTPYYATFFVAPHDLLKDNITGYVYNFTILLQTPWGKYPIAASTNEVKIPDGGQTVVTATVPIVNYGPLSLPNNSSVNFGGFKVDVASIVPLTAAYVLIDGKEYQLTPEDGGFYYYGTGIDQKLKLPAGTYNYTVVVTYPNGKEVKLPQRTVTIKEPLVYVLSPESTVYNTSEINIAVKIVDVLNMSKVTATVNGEVYNLTYNSTLGLYTGLLNLTNGSYTLTITATDVANNTGTATVHFVVHTNAKVVSVPVNNETNVTVGIIGSANVTAKNNTIVANVTTSNGTVEVQIPLVNNVPSVVINTTAINSVITGESNASLVAGWNASATVSTKTTPVKTENSKKIYAVTIKANVSLGENGVAVVAFRNINISKVYVWKNGQKIQLTTNESNPLGYYYIQGSMVLVVLKEDPVIEVDGTYAVSITPMALLSSMIVMYNYMYYHNFVIFNESFSRLYREALSAGVGNETLQKAEKLYEMAVAEYKEAATASGGAVVLNLGDVRVFIHLRKAFVYIKEAIDLLEAAGVS